MTTTHDVVVRKDFPLAKGESIRTATKKLRETGAEFIARKLNTPPNQLDVFPVDVFSTAAVFDVFKRDKPGDPQFFALKFSRTAKGDFEYTDMIEVERVVGFQPKTTVTKSMAESGANTATYVVEGWARTSKSLWEGVL
jgi:hypothetical protein